MRKITIKRKRGFYGGLRALKLNVDDVFVGKIMQGRSVELTISDDAMELVGKMDWGVTDPFSLQDIKDGDTIFIKPYFTWNYLKNVGVQNIPFRIFSDDPSKPFV